MGGRRGGEDFVHFGKLLNYYIIKLNLNIILTIKVHSIILKIIKKSISITSLKLIHM
jgi:hypothetical protein